MELPSNSNLAFKNLKLKYYTSLYDNVGTLSMGFYKLKKQISFALFRVMLL